MAEKKIIGIDLGTTNSAVAFIDPAEARPRARIFPVPQLIAPGEVEERETLPSFHYQPGLEEIGAEALRLPWDGEEPLPGFFAVGVFARDHGADVPERLIASAKSWLCHTGVDRTADLLPWHGAAEVKKLSPADVSAAYLGHIRSAWNNQWPEYPLEDQEVVITIPASFDEIARELTVTAARKAGLPRIMLLEEPQAAFYAWVNEKAGVGGQRSEVSEDEKAEVRSDWRNHASADLRPLTSDLSPFLPGQKILVCDIGGGTSDFTLIEVRTGDGAEVKFHRVAVGDHLILGGDNLDLALAHFVEERLGQRLPTRQWSVLVRRCREAKEALLGPDAPELLSLSIPGAGSKLIGGARQLELTREEVEVLLVDGFLPRVGLLEKPLKRASGFQEFGLPFAPDAAITRYLAAFLAAHGAEKPAFILFNGGLFESPLMRARLLEVIGDWFGSQPYVLENQRLDLAVALGATHYGLARRGVGTRITGGLARSYYIGIDQGEAREALCLAPSGLEEEVRVDLENEFALLVRQPVEFPLYVSSLRTTDRPGDLVPIDPEQLSALPPIKTVLRARGVETEELLKVHLHAELTVIGTLEVWCSEIGGKRRWKLPFDVRSSTWTDVTAHEAEGESAGFFEEAVVEQCRELIQAAFRSSTGSLGSAGMMPGSTSADAESLVKSLEGATGCGRFDWPPSLLRAFWGELMEVKEGRSRSAIHEARWLNLVGFALRPGYGLAADDWRVAQTWRLFEHKIVHERNELCRAEWWILWRRIAGGLTAGQQRAIADPLLATLRKARGKGVKPAWGSHESAEIWRLLASFELLDAEVKIELGDSLENDRIAIWALGRLGARVPMYGPINTIVPGDVALRWADKLIQVRRRDPELYFTLMLLSRFTGDRYRDLSQEGRARILAWMKAAPVHLTELIRTGGDLAQEEKSKAFGESLPHGLRLV
jgi:molecular chaperone DnaK (HSP70)